MILLIVVWGVVIDFSSPAFPELVIFIMHIIYRGVKIIDFSTSFGHAKMKMSLKLYCLTFTFRIKTLVLFD